MSSRQELLLEYDPAVRDGVINNILINQILENCFRIDMICYLKLRIFFLWNSNMYIPPPPNLSHCDVNYDSVICLCHKKF